VRAEFQGAGRKDKLERGTKLVLKAWLKILMTWTLLLVLNARVRDGSSEQMPSSSLSSAAAATGVVLCFVSVRHWQQVKQIVRIFWIRVSCPRKASTLMNRKRSRSGGASPLLLCAGVSAMSFDL